MDLGLDIVRNKGLFKYDQDVTISIGKSRKDTQWRNVTTKWSDIVRKCTQTVRTPESTTQYLSMTRDEQADVKDIGAFVGGTVHGGRRKKDAIKWRSMFTLDADYASRDFLDTFQMVWGSAYALYTTHSHRPESPRIRIIILADRHMTLDEHEAVGRLILNELGWRYFDPTTLEGNRLMYWPSTTVDGEFISDYGDMPPLCVDDWLRKYSDWKDTSQWPGHPEQERRRVNSIKKKGDPREKTGSIGAFCRAYTIQDAIDTYLSDVYSHTGKGRYTYLEGSTSNGLVIYDDGLSATSNHATDPVSAVASVNAFDIVRIHKFGALDEDAEEGTPVHRRPSYDAMVELANKDSRVRAESAGDAIDRQREVIESFGVNGVGVDVAVADSGWMDELERHPRHNFIMPSLRNFTMILEHDHLLRGIAYNAHKEAICLRSDVPWRRAKDWGGARWMDDDESALRVYIERVYQGIWSPQKGRDALATVSRKRTYHPVREYIDGLPAWDGVERLDRLAIDYLGAPDNAYVRAAMRKTLVAAIRRILTPGIKFDTMIVFAGPQGVGKSTLFQRLASGWFSDNLSMSDMRDKGGVEKLQENWIVEISELTGLKKADVETVKSFISRQTDKFRPAYGRHVVEFPRQCIIVGSTNNVDAGYLRDQTGNRRFWPVPIKGTGAEGKKPWHIEAWEVDQVWAEALRLVSTESLILSAEEEAPAEAYRVEAMEKDDREGMIEDYLEQLLPIGWDDMNLIERRRWLEDDDVGKREQGVIRRERVCALEIWSELFGKDPTSLDRGQSNILFGMLHKMDGWVAGTGSVRFRIYGKQRWFYRPSPDSR